MVEEAKKTTTTTEVVEKQPETKLYRLKGVKHSGRDENGNAKDYVTGDMVPLTETQYKAFRDKFDDDEGDELRAPGEQLMTPTAPSHPIDTKTQSPPAPHAPETLPDGSGEGQIEPSPKGAGASEKSSNKATIATGESKTASTPTSTKTTP